MRAVLFGILGFAAVAVAQQAQPAKPVLIEGRVIDALTGAPLRKTTLTLRPVGGQQQRVQQQGGGGLREDPNVRQALNAVTGNAGGAGANARRQYSAITDGEGRYSFTVDQPGDFRVGADHTGYVRGEYGSRRPGAGGKSVTVTAGQRLTGIDVKLTPHGVIAGRIVDEDGDPVERAQVTASSRLGSGTPRSSTVVTNDLGEFRMAGLAAGKYYLMANRMGAVLSDNDADAAQAGQETYAATYFPGATDAASAAAISVTPGQQVTGIFIPLRKARVFKVSGIISGSIGDEPKPPQAPGPNGRPGIVTQQRRGQGGNRVMVNLVERNESGRRVGPQRILNNRAMNADGSFEVPNVPPGSYWALAISPQRGAVVVGRAAVEVRNGNVSNVVVPVAPPVTINGTARPDGRETLTLTNARIVLNPIGETIGMATGNVQATGAFQIPTASRARYRVSALSLPDGAYLKAVRVGGIDVTKAGLDLTSAPASLAIEAVISSKAASVTGTVKLGTENLTGIALLVPDPYVEGESASAPVGTPITVTQAGTFTIKNVPPGAYRLYAFEDVEFQAIDAAMLRRLESRSEKLSLSESATAAVELKQIAAEDSIE